MNVIASVLRRCAPLAIVLPVGAHDSPDDVIHALDHRIEASGATTHLLTSRGFENLARRDWNAAIADFHAALEQRPDYGPAILGCTQAWLHQGMLDKADATARSGLALHGDAAQQAPYHALLARINMRREDWLRALESWRAALRSPRPDVDWFLGEAECLARLARFDEQSAALAEAMKRNPSVVIRRAWIRALVDAGELNAASHEIKREIVRARWKSTWLLLKARICARQGDRDGQHTAASEALAEIRSRLNPGQPDPYLIAESALALEFLDEPDEARAFMERARAMGVPETSFRELGPVAVNLPSRIQP